MAGKEEPQLGCHGLRIRVHRGEEQRVRMGRIAICKWQVGMALLENVNVRGS